MSDDRTAADLLAELLEEIRGLRADLRTSNGPQVDERTRRVRRLEPEERREVDQAAAAFLRKVGR